jgi:hypothetical protein
MLVEYINFFDLPEHKKTGINWLEKIMKFKEILEE